MAGNRGAHNVVIANMLSGIIGSVTGGYSIPILSTSTGIVVISVCAYAAIANIAARKVEIAFI